MDRIDLALSDSAKALLAELLQSIGYDSPITTVMWSDSGYSISPDGEKRDLQAGWGVGWHRPEMVPEDRIQIIDGFKFVFDQGAISRKLNGTTLDAENGLFIVR